MKSGGLVTLEGWQTLLRQFKEALAKRLWAMPTVSESEKELVFKEYLSDLDKFDKGLATFFDEVESREKSSKEENDLLRSLLGVPGDDLKTRAVALTNEVGVLRAHNEDLTDQLDTTKELLRSAETENAELRRRLKEMEDTRESTHLEAIRARENDIRFYSETNESLKNQLQDLESRLLNLRTLFNDSNKQLLAEKQEEISLLQKNLLDEMEQTLKKRQQLAWAAEEMFAKGVAQKVRTVLVSAQGQLFLTLEQLGLLDPSTKTESFWKARFKILVQGAEELGRNFRALQAQIQEVTESLDDYLHLTHRRELGLAPISLVDIVKKEIANLYLDRRPTLQIEFLPDDPLPDLMGDKELIEHSVHSLIQNSLESLPNGSGRITITIRNRSHEGRIEFVIKDSGHGIPDHLQSRLFQPFFTTKTGHQGLSLSRAKRFVELHAGTLELVQSSPQGSIFQMTLRLDGGN